MRQKSPSSRERFTDASVGSSQGQPAESRRALQAPLIVSADDAGREPTANEDRDTQRAAKRRRCGESIVLAHKTARVAADPANLMTDPRTSDTPTFAQPLPPNRSNACRSGVASSSSSDISGDCINGDAILRALRGTRPAAATQSGRESKIAADSPSNSQHQQTSVASLVSRLGRVSSLPHSNRQLGSRPCSNLRTLSDRPETGDDDDHELCRVTETEQVFPTATFGRGSVNRDSLGKLVLSWPSRGTPAHKATSRLRGILEKSAFARAACILHFWQKQPPGARQIICGHALSHPGCLEKADYLTQLTDRNVYRTHSRQADTLAFLTKYCLIGLHLNSSHSNLQTFWSVIELASRGRMCKAFDELSSLAEKEHCFSEDFSREARIKSFEVPNSIDFGAASADCEDSLKSAVPACSTLQRLRDASYAARYSKLVQRTLTRRLRALQASCSSADVASSSYRRSTLPNLARLVRICCCSLEQCTSTEIPIWFREMFGTYAGENAARHRWANEMGPPKREEPTLRQNDDLHHGSAPTVRTWASKSSQVLVKRETWRSLGSKLTEQQKSLMEHSTTETNNLCAAKLSVNNANLSNEIYRRACHPGTRTACSVSGTLTEALAVVGSGQRPSNDYSCSCKKRRASFADTSPVTSNLPCRSGSLSGAGNNHCNLPRPVMPSNGSDDSAGSKSGLRSTAETLLPHGGQEVFSSHKAIIKRSETPSGVIGAARLSCDAFNWGLQPANHGIDSRTVPNNLDQHYQSGKLAGGVVSGHTRGEVQRRVERRPIAAHHWPHRTAVPPPASTSVLRPAKSAGPELTDDQIEQELRICLEPCDPHIPWADFLERLERVVWLTKLQSSRRRERRGAASVDHSVLSLRYQQHYQLEKHHQQQRRQLPYSQERHEQQQLSQRWRCHQQPLSQEPSEQRRQASQHNDNRHWQTHHVYQPAQTSQTPQQQHQLQQQQYHDHCQAQNQGHSWRAGWPRTDATVGVPPDFPTNPQSQAVVVTGGHSVPASRCDTWQSLSAADADGSGCHDEVDVTRISDNANTLPPTAGRCSGSDTVITVDDIGACVDIGFAGCGDDAASAAADADADGSTECLSAGSPEAPSATSSPPASRWPASYRSGGDCGDSRSSSTATVSVTGSELVRPDSAAQSATSASSEKTILLDITTWAVD